jgi:hypothetical protein
MGRVGDGESGRWGEWAMGRCGEGAMERVGDGAKDILVIFQFLIFYFRLRALFHFDLTLKQLVR